jgi:hypothetical protein
LKICHLAILLGNVVERNGRRWSSGSGWLSVRDSVMNRVTRIGSRCLLLSCLIGLLLKMTKVALNTYIVGCLFPQRKLCMFNLNKKWSWIHFGRFISRTPLVILLKMNVHNMLPMYVYVCDWNWTLDKYFFTKP